MEDYFFNNGDTVFFIWENRFNIKKKISGFIIKKTNTKYPGFVYSIGSNLSTEIVYSDSDNQNKTTTLYTIRTIHGSIYENIRLELIQTADVLLIEYIYH